MPGRPRTRAKRAAQEAAQAALPAQGSQAPARASARTRTRKAPSKGKASSKRTPKPKDTRPRFAPATRADYELIQAQLADAHAKAAKKGAALTPAERVERDENIVSLWALGLTPPTIAERVDLHPVHVARIIDEYRSRRRDRVLPSSSDLLADTLDRLEALTERVSLLASSSDTDAVKLGAMRTLAELEGSRLGLLQAMGLVSTRPSDDARQQRARDLLRSLLDVLRDLGIPQEKLDEAARRVLHPGADANVATLEARATAVET